MTESLTDGVTLGIYEKALGGNPLATDNDWRRFRNQDVLWIQVRRPSVSCW